MTSFTARQGLNAQIHEMPSFTAHQCLDVPSHQMPDFVRSAESSMTSNGFDYTPERSPNDSMNDSTTSHNPYPTIDYSNGTDPSIQQGRSARRAMKQWKRIPLENFVHECCRSATFPVGWKFSVFNNQVTLYYEIHSENVQPTYGAIRYIEHYNELGPYSRFRFQLCQNFLNGNCRKGYECTYVHALSLTRPCTVHVNGLQGYETLPTEFSLYVFAPSSNSAPQLISGANILRNAGSDRAYRDALTNGGSALHPPQHCAHFQYKRVCNRGDQCAFIHANVPRPR